MTKFNFETFTNLIKFKWIKRAEEYRDSFKTNNPIEIEKDTQTWIEKSKNSNKWAETVVEEQKDINTNKQQEEAVTSEDNNKEWEEIEVSRDELKEKLQNANIEFVKNAKTEKLVKLCIENNLL